MRWTMKASKRWQYVFGLASKISRCGEDSEDGVRNEAAEEDT